MLNFQDDMFEQLKKKKGQVTFFLKSGVPIRGEIITIDKFTVFMMAQGKKQLIYKQAISTIVT